MRDGLQREPGECTGQESRRKPLVRADSFPSVLPVIATREHPEDTRKAALTRAFAEMFDLSDRFNTEET